MLQAGADLLLAGMTLGAEQRSARADPEVVCAAFPLQPMDQFTDGSHQLTGFQKTLQAGDIARA